MSLPPFIRILRPANSIAVGMLVLASCLVVAPSAEISRQSTILAVLGSVLISAGGYALNDVFDRNIDGIIHKDRVLPKREIGERVALMYALMLLWAAPLLFLFVNRLSFLNAILVSLLLFLYSWILKSRSGVIGNLVTALLTSNAALIGGYVIGDVSKVAPLAICVFFATISREIAKDVEDLEGDKTSRARTLPMLVGINVASRSGALFLCLAILATYLPYQQGIFDQLYLIVASGINIIVLHTALQFALGQRERIGTIQRMIKFGMILYIFLFLVAAIFMVKGT